MLTKEEIRDMWSCASAQDQGSETTQQHAFARTVEREAYKRAAAECRDLAQKYQTFGRTMPSQASRLLYVSMNAGVLNAADAIEALGREE